jgi:hypothetical protein
MSNQKCKYFCDCSAPLCPEDPESLSHSSWFADEEICRKRPVPEWVKRQRRIAKKLNFDNERGCFTKKMLERKAKISFKMHGVDPSKGPPHKQEEKWLKNHPGPSKKTATARAFNAQESHHGGFNGVSAAKGCPSTGRSL